MKRDLQIVGLRIGRETFGLPISLVREIVRVPEITPVPNAPDHIEGVINLRGKIIAVIDLRKRFGETDVERNSKNRIVVVEMEERLVGLLVNSASEVLRIAPSEIEAPQNVFPNEEMDYVTGVGKLQGPLDYPAGPEPDSAERRIAAIGRSRGTRWPRHGPRAIPPAVTDLASRAPEKHVHTRYFRPSRRPTQRSNCCKHWSIKNAACFSTIAASTFCATAYSGG